MLPQAALIALSSAAVFTALVLMTDRKRGAFFAQIGLTFAAVLLFVAILLKGPVAGVSPRGLAAFAVGLISANVAGMLYHLYLGRFERAWSARRLFTAVYLALSALFGLLFLSLI